MNKDIQKRIILSYSALVWFNSNKLKLSQNQQLMLITYFMGSTIFKSHFSSIFCQNPLNQTGAHFYIVDRTKHEPNAFKLTLKLLLYLL